MSDCSCGSGRPFEGCCGPYLSGEKLPESAEALMRSRYSAYVRQQIPYLGDTLHPDHRDDYDEAATRRWAQSADWTGLEVRSSAPGGDADEELVEFIASYRVDAVPHRHHEIGRFRRSQGRWYYVDGQAPRPATQVREEPKVGRNDPCTCGSGKKYKKCCGR